MTYSRDELDDAALRDLLSDAEGAERQSASGPFYPDRGITAESLSAYAKMCREKADRYALGGAHAAVLLPA